MKNKYILLFCLLLFIVDRLIKYFAFYLPDEGIFYFSQVGFKLHLNQGLAFSLPLGQFLIIIISSLITITLISFWLKFYKSRTFLQDAEQNSVYSGKVRDKVKNFILINPLTLIIIGALSNLLDRIKFGAVIDLIDIWLWPAFNLSDCYIIIGVIWLIWLIHKGLPKNAG